MRVSGSRPRAAQAAAIGLAFGASCALAIILSGCARNGVSVVNAGHVQETGNWSVDQRRDAITGQQTANAFVRASRTTASSTVFPPAAMLQLTCFKGGPTITFFFGSPLGTNVNSVLSYRFDEIPGHETVARFLTDRRTVVIEEPQSAALFLDGLGKAQRLYIRARSLNAIAATAEFQIDGGAEAMRQALASCPPVAIVAVPPELAPRRRTGNTGANAS